MRVEESIEVGADRERVWQRIAAPEGYGDFMVGSSWEPVAGEPTTGPRARFEIGIEVGSIDLGGIVELVEHDPPHELAWTSITGIDQRGRWILRDREGRTEVTLRISYQVPGGVLALVASRLSRPVIRRDVRRSLARLKELMEAGTE
ncbi:MAG: SRPBCC family protein [Solirubrobacterales bacterium]